MAAIATDKLFSSAFGSPPLSWLISRFSPAFRFQKFWAIRHRALGFVILRANAYAERWVRTVREECLYHILVINENHLQNVLREYTDYCNLSRPHQGISQHFPVSSPERSIKGMISGKIFWEGLSTIISGSLQPRFLTMDRFFAPYREGCPWLWLS